MAIGVRLRDFVGFVEFFLLYGSCCRIFVFFLFTLLFKYTFSNLLFLDFFFTAIQNIKFLQ